MVLRMLPFPISREAIPRCRRRRAAPGALVAGIGPEPGGLGSARAGRQHPDRRVVGEDRLGREHVPPDGVGQRLQQGGGLADPVGERGAVEVQPLAFEDLALAVERQVVGVLADQHMGEQPRTGAAALDRAGRQRRLDEALAAGAGQPGPDDAVHDEASGHIFQLFGHVFTDAAQLAAASGAGVSRRAEFHLHPWDMVRDRTALRLTLFLDVGQAQPRGHHGRRNLARLQRQLQLLGCLGGSPEPVRAVPGQLMTQLLDQDRLRLHLGQKPRRKGAQLLGIFWQRGSLVEHDRVYPTGFPVGILGSWRGPIIPRPKAARSAAASASRCLRAASPVARASATPCLPWPAARRSGLAPGASRTCRPLGRPTR